MDEETETQVVDSERDSGRAVRVRSTIVFPYFGLEEAVGVADVVHSHYGGRCDFDQLAASLDQKASSGGFRLKVSATRIFGLVTTSGQTVSVTDLGSHAVDERTGKRARTEAFLHVPLYQALFERFRGRSLPNDKGLEGAIRDLGVSEKQVTTARLAFQKSADYAGFFAHGRDRLVMPAGGTMVPEPASESTASGREAPASSSESPSIMAHPQIVGMLGALPEPGQDFPQDDRDLWLEAAKVNLQLIYGKPRPATTTRSRDAEEQRQNLSETFKGSGTEPLT
jgi:hypothetical protein